MAITLSINGMTCEHCVRSVNKALQAVAGVEKVLISLEARRAVVDGKTDHGALIQAIEDEGYKAKVEDSI